MHVIYCLADSRIKYINKRGHGNTQLITVHMDGKDFFAVLAVSYYTSVGYILPY